MIFLASISIAVAVALTVYLVGQMIPARPRAVRDRLAEIEALALDTMSAQARRTFETRYTEDANYAALRRIYEAALARRGSGRRSGSAVGAGV